MRNENRTKKKLLSCGYYMQNMKPSVYFTSH